MDDLHVERLAALAELPLAGPEVSVLLEQITQHVQELLPASDASLLLWDARTESFTLSASTVAQQRPEYVLGNVRAEGGASRWIVDEQKPIVMADIADDPFVANKMLAESSLKAYLGTPIVFEGTSLGVLYALDQSPRDYSPTDVDFMSILARRAASAIGFARLFEQVQQLANTDELTGVSNRREFLRQAGVEFERESRNGLPLTAVMIDLDHFKQINDQHGHGVGDRVLTVVAKRCCAHIRSIDVFGRLGGEEFAILLPEVDTNTAAHIAERLRASVSASPIDTEQGPIDITITLGVAGRTELTSSLEDLLNRADLALYDGKTRGRDRVAVYGADAPSD